MTNPSHTESTGRWPIVELRQYTLHAGRRDALIELFDREFIESQEALGMRVLAQFRDLDAADRFVWLRGFASMAARAAGLAAFYGGPVWKAHREAANATMIDSDDVLLLKPAFADAPAAIETWQRADTDSAAMGGALIAVFDLADAPPDALAAALALALERACGTHAGAYVTEAAVNNFPALPVREGERVFVWIARFYNPVARDRLAEELRASAHFTPLQVLRLSPTNRSRF
jgi:NIPSNAP